MIQDIGVYTANAENITVNPYINCLGLLPLPEDTHGRNRKVKSLAGRESWTIPSHQKNGFQVRRIYFKSGDGCSSTEV